MTHLIIIRGAPASGKTTITKELLSQLKLKYHKDCASISEDHFRKELQNKYKANNPLMHLQSAHLITNLINELQQIDEYHYIFIEGLFRYPQIMEVYEQFAESNNFQTTFFQMDIPLEILEKRNQQRVENGLRSEASEDIQDIIKDINTYTPPQTIYLRNVNKEEHIKQILPFIL